MKKCLKCRVLKVSTYIDRIHKNSLKIKVGRRINLRHKNTYLKKMSFLLNLKFLKLKDKYERKVCTYLT